MPNLPTDNLYKFMAIFGLVVFGFSVYIPLRMFDDYGRELARWHATREPLATRAKHHDDDAREALQCAISRAKDGRPTRECEEIEAARRQQEAASRDLQRALDELRGAKELLLHMRSHVVLIIRIGGVFGVIGLACMICGFWLWYIKLQRPMDESVKRNTISGDA